MIKKLLLLAFAVVAFAACSKDDDSSVEATGIELNEKTVQLNPGGSLQLVASVTPADAGGVVAWKSGDEAVVTVSDKGLITAVAPGKAAVTASCGKVSASCEVTVTLVEATDIELNEKTAQLNPGGTLQLVASVTPADAGGVVTWKSGNEAVVTVSDKGLITALAPGTAAVTASCGKVSASCEVTVMLVEATGIELNEKTARLNPGGSLQLIASLTPADAGVVVTWKSGDEAVVTVSDKGLITAVAPGKAAVTASCGKVSASCEVTVVAPFEVISFETSEQMSGIDGKAVALGDITVVSGKNSKVYKNLYWAKGYTEANDLRDDYDQLFFAAPLFSTANGATWFSSYYCDCTIYGAQYDAWGGFMVSSNANKTVSSTQAGLDNQFEVYADGGADGSKNFAVCYDAKSAGMAMSADCCWPQIDFTNGLREVVSVSLANNTWVYNYFKGNEGNSYAIRITGSKAGVKTGEVLCSLIDGAKKVDGWKVFDLSSLGEVDCLVFAVVSSEPYAPFYFCVDNVVLKNK